MSDFLAVGGVSAVLKWLLNAGLSDAGLSPILQTPPGITNKALDLIPTGPDEPAQLNIFMYYASINPALRNLGLPSANSAGAPLGNPPLAINLHFLVTALGSSAYDPEMLLGYAMKVFHDTPVVPRSTIQTALSDLASGTPSPEQKMVSASTLASQAENLRITPEALTTEEIYRLWAAFQAPYRPTTSYQVSVVLIQDDKSYTSNLPVRRRSVLALPLVGPIIEAASPPMVATGQILTLTGSNFLGDTASGTQVSFNGLAPVVAATVQGDVVRVAVPPTLQAGTCSVRVLRSVTFPSSVRPHPGFSSNPIPFQVIPAIQLPASPPIQAKIGQPLTLSVVPDVGYLQKVVVFFGDLAVPVPDVPLTGPALSGTVKVTVPSTLAAATYPLRIEVDGAQSRLSMDSNPVSPTFGQWLPQVAVSA